jgi:hypothetical protein
MALKQPHIGELRQSGTLQTNNPLQQGAGKKDNYTTLLTCRGRLTQLRSNRGLDLSETTLSNAWEWICRYQIAISNVANKKSIRWQIDGRNFSVNSYELIDQKKHYYRFVLLENE